MKTPKLLIIAGFDPTSGAGLTSDCLTAYALDVYPMCVTTAITVQNDLGVLHRQDVPPDLVKAQLEGLLSRFHFDAVKIGMIGNIKTLAYITDALKKYSAKIGPIILDPLLFSSNGYPLCDLEVFETLKRELVPLVTLITPNLHEFWHLFSQELLDWNASAPLDELETIPDQQWFERIKKSHTDCPLDGHVLVKGGHLQETSIDFLLLNRAYFENHQSDVPACSSPQDLEVTLDQTQAPLIQFKAQRLLAPYSHGTGCMLSTSIACFLALDLSIISAVYKAKVHLRSALKHPHLFDEDFGALCKKTDM